MTPIPRQAARGVLLASLALLGACASQAPTMNAVARQHTSTGFHSRPLSPVEAGTLAAELVPLARMAERVYRYDIDNPAQRAVTGCEYAQDLAIEGHPRWRRLDAAMIRQLDQRAGTHFEGRLAPCRTSVGLAYDTFVRLSESGAPEQAAIAFRGTENNRVEWVADWWANLSQLDFGADDNAQFRVARLEGQKLVQALVAWLPARSPNAACKEAGALGRQAPLVLVGHSLGGGLAQHLAYASKPCDVLRTVTFDTSPVTGFFYLNKHSAVATREPHIDRVYMNGEALAYVRAITTRFTFARERRTDYNLRFAGVRGNLGSLHSMSLLATQLALFAAPPDSRLAAQMPASGPLAAGSK